MKLTRGVVKKSQMECLSQGTEGHKKGALGDVSRNTSDGLGEIASAVRYNGNLMPRPIQAKRPKPALTLVCRITLPTYTTQLVSSSTHR